MHETPPVAETAETVLDFWFLDLDAADGDLDGDLPGKLAAAQKRWFGGQASFDAEITRRFSALLERLADGEAEAWAAQGPRNRLAAVIVLDQFSRNIHRDTPAAFANDKLALRLAQAAPAAGEDAGLSPMQRVFMLLPFEHSEAMDDQTLSVAEFTRLHAEAEEPYRTALASTLDYARRHAEVIARFGRFPHRNVILGRDSTREEVEFLKQPGSKF